MQINITRKRKPSTLVKQIASKFTLKPPVAVVILHASGRAISTCVECALALRKAGYDTVLETGTNERMEHVEPKSLDEDYTVEQVRVSYIRVTVTRAERK